MIAAMISGRLKSPAKWELVPPRFTTRTTATMIAPDAANRATQVLIETNDDDLGRALRKMNAGAMLTVSGELALQAAGTVLVRARSITALQPTQNT